MTAVHLTKEEGMEAGGKAQRIQKAINTAIGRRFVQCSAPMRFELRYLNPDPDVLAHGLELRIEPLLTITDFRDDPARRIATTKLRVGCGYSE